MKWTRWLVVLIIGCAFSCRFDEASSSPTSSNVLVFVCTGEYIPKKNYLFICCFEFIYLLFFLFLARSALYDSSFLVFVFASDQHDLTHALSLSLFVCPLLSHTRSFCLFREDMLSMAQMTSTTVFVYRNVSSFICWLIWVYSVWTEKSLAHMMPMASKSSSSGNLTKQMIYCEHSTEIVGPLIRCVR